MGKRNQTRKGIYFGRGPDGTVIALPIEFVNALAEHHMAMKLHGGKHPIAIEKMIILLELAPDSHKDSLRKKAEELGLTPIYH